MRPTELNSAQLLRRTKKHYLEPMGCGKQTPVAYLSAPRNGLDPAKADLSSGAG